MSHSKEVPGRRSASRKRKSRKAVKRTPVPAPESVSTAPVLSESLQEAFIEFLQQQPAKYFSKNLRRMLIEYLMSESGRASVYITETLAGLDCLFELLDVAEEEWRE